MWFTGARSSVSPLQPLSVNYEEIPAVCNETFILLLSVNRDFTKNCGQFAFVRSSRVDDSYLGLRSNVAFHEIHVHVLIALMLAYANYYHFIWVLIWGIRFRLCWWFIWQIQNMPLNGLAHNGNGWNDKSAGEGDISSGSEYISH